MGATATSVNGEHRTLFSMWGSPCTRYLSSLFYVCEGNKARTSITAKLAGHIANAIARGLADSVPYLRCPTSPFHRGPDDAPFPKIKALALVLTPPVAPSVQRTPSLFDEHTTSDATGLQSSSEPNAATITLISEVFV